MEKNRSLGKDIGDLLEQTVEDIESFIIQNHPTLKSVPFTIERNKLVFFNGVKHEIDIIIKFDLGSAYGAGTFIFECKNRLKTSSKTDILDFTEKIRATGAQKGYFVSKKIGKYAELQAAQDKRVVLIKATELKSLEAFTGFKIEKLKNPSLSKVFATLQKNLNSSDLTPTQVNSEMAFFNFKGVDVKAKEFLLGYANDAVNESVKDIDPSSHSSSEISSFQIIKEIIFNENELFYDNKQFLKIILIIDFQLFYVDPVIVCMFDISSRGKVAKIKYSNPATKLELIFSFFEIPSLNLA